jgi:very-short-patch-repair endonuclease
MSIKNHKHETIDWTIIQQDYNGGLTLRDILKKYKLSYFLVYKAKDSGLFVTKTKSEATKESHRLRPDVRKPSEETKKKISASRIKYLTENPDKVPYRLNHSSKESYPEMIFRKALESSGISGWEQSYRCGIYEYDFAFPVEKIDIEIDGATHKLEKVIIIDERRDRWTESNGWKVIRFEAQKVKTDVVGCIALLRSML